MLRVFFFSSRTCWIPGCHHWHRSDWIQPRSSCSAKWVTTLEQEPAENWETWKLMSVEDSLVSGSASPYRKQTLPVTRRLLCLLSQQFLCFTLFLLVSQVCAYIYIYLLLLIQILWPNNVKILLCFWKSKSSHKTFWEEAKLVPNLTGLAPFY